jgi:hypothetical protein
VLHKLTGVKLKMSSAYHLETDGASERSNKTINQSIRYHVRHNQKGWVHVLPKIRFDLMNLQGEGHRKRGRYESFLGVVGNPCRLHTETTTRPTHDIHLPPHRTRTEPSYPLTHRTCRELPQPLTTCFSLPGHGPCTPIAVSAHAIIHNPTNKPHSGMPPRAHLRYPCAGTAQPLPE